MPGPVARTAGTCSLVTSPVSSVSSSTIGEPARDALGRVDDHRDDRHAPAQLPEAVAVGRVVAVVAPDAAQRRGAGRAGGAQRAHELDVERSLRVARLLAAVDHQLLPHRQPGRVGGRDRLGHGQPPAVALAHAHALERQQRLGQQRAQLGQRGGDALAGADGDDHQRHLRVGGEEARAPALAARGAVDAQQHGGARRRRGDAARRRRPRTPAARRRARRGRGRR